MINGKGILIGLGAGFVFGLLVGAYSGLSLFCQNSDSAIVKQLEKDEKKVAIIKEKKAERKVGYLE